MTTASEQRFEFGKNWRDFVEKNFDDEKIEISKRHILDFLQRKDLKGFSVLDIGCGSGLHSIGMLDAGAKCVHGFDYDPSSVDATQFIQEKVGKPVNWTVEQGSVLDDKYMTSLPKSDLVYSWGVLHHTGDVWHAIRNAADRVAPNGGLFYIALYAADVQINPTPEFWLDVKRRYNSGDWLHRRMMDAWYIWRFEMNYSLMKLPRFLAKRADYKKNRGMNVMTDIRDWLGGWPMEFVYDKEAIAFVENLGFKLDRIATGHANTEFLFVRGPLR